MQKLNRLNFAQSDTVGDKISGLVWKKGKKLSQEQKVFYVKCSREWGKGIRMKFIFQK